MRIGNKIFPYPILNKNERLSNYLNCSFDIIFHNEEDEKRIIFKDIMFESDSDLINELYDTGKIDVVCIVECSETVFREKYRVTKEKSDIILYKADLSERTNVTFFAYALEDFVMESNEFEENYRGIKFEIEKYDIIAADDDKFITVSHQEMENSLAESIFSIVNQHDKNDGIYSVDYSTKKITIYLSDEDYKNYKVIAGINEYKEIFFNMLLIPALIDAITTCKNEVLNGASIADVYDSHVWFRSMMKAYKRVHNEELTEDILKNTKPIEMSQELLGKPLNTSFEKMLEKQQIPEGDN